MTNPQMALADELREWDISGARPRLFLRDDDAICDTPALRQLFGFCEKNSAPLLLASIPQPAQKSLGEAVQSFGLATGAVHGFAHLSHSPAGEKPCELGRHRPVAIVINELLQGREKLEGLFGGKVSGLLVPPWNRIHDEVAVHVQEAGFTGISAHGWVTQPPPHGLAIANAHIDIVHWSGGRTGRDWAWVAGELAKAFGEARRRGFRATGILTHHLAHDDKAWEVLAKIGSFASTNGLPWIAADELISEPAETPTPLFDQA